MKVKIGLISTSILLLLFVSPVAISNSCDIQYSSLSSLRELEIKNQRWHQRKVVSDRKYHATKKQIDACINQWKDTNLRTPM